MFFFVLRDNPQKLSSMISVNIKDKNKIKIRSEITKAEIRAPSSKVI